MPISPGSPPLKGGKVDNYVGEKLGNYRLTRLLGSGGFAEVYLGEHIYLKTQAAIKVLRVSLDDEALAEFLTEARTIAHLEHPNIVRTLEFGVQGSTAYLVMSYAPNGTVLRRYPRGSIVPLHIVVQYVRQIADALQYAHAHELIHRDVKPENILLERDGGILLSDFGLAVLSPSSQSTRLIDKAGTITYMAPEQIEGKPSRGSDQYALGVVVYEWLCGSLPFTGLEQEIAVQHIQVPPPPLCKRAPSVPPAIEQVVMKALAKDPSQRFLSVLHFARVLEEAYQPHKLVRLLRSGSNVHSVDARDTPLKHDTHSIAEPEPFSGLQSPSVLDSNDDDKIMSSPQNMPTGQAAPEPSAQTPRRVSRRIILAGLAGLTAVSAVSAGAIWSFRDLRFSASSSRGFSGVVQPSSASQATPGTMQFPRTTNSPTPRSSTPSTTPGNPHTKAAQNVGSTPSTTSAPTAMPAPQATPTANTTSPSAHTFTANTTPTPMPTPTPTPQPQPTPPGKGQQGTQGQQNDQGQNDQ
jgi:serine/threonine protein kinase